MQWSRRLLLPCDLRSAARARSFVRRLLVEQDATERVDDVQVVVSELATNAVVHAETAFTLTVSREGPVLRVRVADAAPHRSLPPGMRGSAVDGRDAGGLLRGGRGLLLVDAVSDGWGSERLDGRAKAVWATFALD